MADRPRIDPLQILTEASEVAADHPLDLDDLLRALASLVRKVVDYQLFAVLLADADGSMTIRYSIGYRSDLVSMLRVRPGEGITGHAAQYRETVVVDDVRRDPRYLMAVDAVRSEIAVPLVARGKLVGVIDLQSPQPGSFGEAERGVLELIGSRFSLAIDAAQLYQQTARQNETLKTLTEIAQEFSQILRLEELLEKISSLIRNLVRYDAFSIYLREGDRLKHYFGVRFDERVQWQTVAIGQGVVGIAAETKRPLFIHDTEEDERYIAAVEGIRSEVAVPLVLKDEMIGVVDLESDQVGAFTAEHMRVLNLLAPQIASAVENARLYEEIAQSRQRLKSNLQAARELQRYLLPNGRPEFEGIEVAARNRPAAEVSGDLYDFHPFPGECFGALSGDVSGKGAAAALYAALTSGLIRSLAAKHHQPRVLLGAINEALLERHIEARYLVATYAHWEPDRRRMTIANAGHPQPLLVRDGRAEKIDVSGTPLGLFPGGQYDEVSIDARPGDVFVTASDGVSDAYNSKGEQYGEERLMRLLEAHAGEAPVELLDAIFADVQGFTGRKSPADDCTVVVIRTV